MAIYHYIKCPHCKGLVEYSIGKPKHFGSPFRICKYCGREYIDTNYIEPALLEKKDLEPSFSWSGFVTSILMSLFLIGYPISFLVLDGLGGGAGTIIISILILLAVFAGGIAMLVYTINQLKTYIQYNPSKDGKLQKEIEASKARLSNPEYVIALWKAGAHVTLELLDWAKNAMDNTTENMETSIADEDVQHIDNKISYCRKCGFKLESDSRFCRKCGTEVKENNNDLQ